MSTVMRLRSCIHTLFVPSFLSFFFCSVRCNSPLSRLSDRTRRKNEDYKDIRENLYEMGAPQNPVKSFPDKRKGVAARRIRVGRVITGV